jgi:Protein of unknown function (DUF3309)
MLIFRPFQQELLSPKLFNLDQIAESGRREQSNLCGLTPPAAWRCSPQFAARASSLVSFVRGTSAPSGRLFACNLPHGKLEATFMLSTILIIILILLLIGALPTWPYSSGWGYYPGGGLGLILVIVIILALLGRI